MAQATFPEKAGYVGVFLVVFFEDSVTGPHRRDPNRGRRCPRPALPHRATRPALRGRIGNVTMKLGVSMRERRGWKQARERESAASQQEKREAPRASGHTGESALPSGCGKGKAPEESYGSRGGGLLFSGPYALPGTGKPP